MDQEEIKQSILNQEDIQEKMKLASFEIYQEIMDKYVGIVIARAEPVAKEAIQQVEKETGGRLDMMYRETLVGTIAIGIWAEISNNLNGQIYQQALSEPEVLQ